MKKILGWDCGYGDNKAILMTEDGQILQKFKFPSMIGITKKNAHIKDSRIYDFQGHSYYVGDQAKHLPSENIVDITEYKNLQYYSPLFLAHAIDLLGDVPDMIVGGLSKAQIQHSGTYKANLQSFTVNDKNYNFEEVYVLPQGAGSKLAIDKYGNDFPNEQKEFSGDMTYVGADLGFGTVDLFFVTDGKTSPNLFEGIEKEGVMKIATIVAKHVKKDHNRNITLQEAKEILDTGVYKLRGQKYDYKEVIQEVKKTYLKELLELIESKYGAIIDKCDFISLSGGGSTIFKTTDDGFIKVPKSHHEYYNALGFSLFGLTKC